LANIPITFFDINDYSEGDCCNIEWKMENGKLKMENGKWKIENGRWKMGNGKWKVEN
jgi:hypothetical protein